MGLAKSGHHFEVVNIEVIFVVVSFGTESGLNRDVVLIPRGSLGEVPLQRIIVM